MTYNLLIDFRGLSALLTERLDVGPGADLDDEDVLTAFFLAAGMHQILEDHLHRIPYVLTKAEARLRRSQHPVAAVGGRVVEGLITAVSALSTRLHHKRRIARLGDEVAKLLHGLADALFTDSRSRVIEEARQRWETLRAALPGLPDALLGGVMRLPNAFAKFDDTPADYRELARRFAARWPDLDRPILIVGVRTSGNYLSPLYHVLLRAEGYRDVEMLTVRPGHPWRRTEVSLLRAFSDRGGLTLIVDDPPAYGRVSVRVVQTCLRYGAAPGSIVLILPLFGPEDSLPEGLRPYHSVLLPWREWAVHERLSPASVQRALASILAGREIRCRGGRVIRVADVTAAERLDTGASSDRAGRRGHASGVYRARFVSAAGEAVDQEVYVQGTGLGYFGDHARAVASALPEYLPELYGFRDGLVYREWLPDEWRLDPSRFRGVEPRVAAYVLDRRRRLPVEPDLAARAVHQYAGWEGVADMLGIALLGALRIFVFPLTNAVARRLIKTTRPCLLDGTVTSSDWFAPSSAGAADGALKVDPDQRAFANAARLSYDPIFDLASAGASFDVAELIVESEDVELGRSFSERLVDTYAALSDEEVDGERWFLYQLLYNRNKFVALSSALARSVRPRRESQDETGPPDELEDMVRRLLATERALAAAHQRYVSGVYLADLVAPETGPLCALDVDWVLETRWLDFPAITPAGALALRALVRHGCRPVIASGRSLGEIRERCRAYRLAGGVAEYGAVVYDHLSDRARPQLRPTEEAELARLRKVLRKMPGVHLDHAYRYAVRAVCVSDLGTRRRLNDETIASAIGEARVEDSVQVLYGGLQTDFAPVSINKGTGLRALAHDLGVADAERPFDFAIGDDWPDVPMFELAKRAFAPANVPNALRRELEGSLSLQVVDGRHGRGLLQAVTAFLGHEPRGCRTCAVPHVSSRTKLVTIPLAASDGPRRARLRQTAALAWALARSTHGSTRGTDT